MADPLLGWSKSAPSLATLCVESVMSHHESIEKDAKKLLEMPYDGILSCVALVMHLSNDISVVRQQIASIVRAEVMRLAQNVDVKEEEQDDLKRGRVDILERLLFLLPCCVF